MTHLEKFDDYLYAVQKNLGNAYSELVAYIKEQGGEINFGKGSSDFAWLKQEGYDRVLKAKQCKRVRLADCTWNGELEVLFEGENADDEFAWVSLAWDDEFIDFNLNNIYEEIKQIN